MAASYSGARERRRSVRPRRRRWNHPRRRQNLALLAGLLAVAVLLLGLGWGMDQYRQNVVINLGADIVGAIITIFVITPIVSRVGEGRVREHPRLDYAWYVEQIAGSTSAVRIMDTYSNLFDGPHTAEFFEAVELALERQTVVQILLLDPDSPAASQRADELDDPVVYREIMRNLRVLYHFRHTTLPAPLSRNFDVRIYSASPAITVYRWDGKALVSFFPVGTISSQGVQLEVTVDSPLGTFVNERFNSLWTRSKDLEKFMRLPMTLAGTDVADSHLEVEFVSWEGEVYVNDSRIVAELARRKAGPVLAYSNPDLQELSELAVIDAAEAELLAALQKRFMEKYGHSVDVFVGLQPVKQD